MRAPVVGSQVSVLVGEGAAYLLSQSSVIGQLGHVHLSLVELHHQVDHAAPGTYHMICLVPYNPPKEPQEVQWVVVCCTEKHL